jgi:hypothetical protein
MPWLANAPAIGEPNDEHEMLSGGAAAGAAAARDVSDGPAGLDLNPNRYESFEGTFVPAELPARNVGAEMLSKFQFSGIDELARLHRLHAFGFS